LFLHVLGENKAWLLAHLDDELPGDKVARFNDLIERRYAGEPIQYITGEQEFYGLPFRVTADVLIPRPETEHLVEKALGLAAEFERPRIVDVGTGSGAIPLRWHTDFPWRRSPLSIFLPRRSMLRARMRRAMELAVGSTLSRAISWTPLRTSGLRWLFPIRHTCRQPTETRFP
jgi:hypothetical protein